MAGDPRIRGEHYLLVQPAPEAADHPRIRGEHRIMCIPVLWTSGSSPHTRGARLPGAGVGRECGIIPAYAGSTPPRASPTSGTKDHPRIRGEHPYGVTRWLDLVGSSPHTRGARRRRIRLPRRTRIIPAYAGSTRTVAGRSCRAGDHPRIRGEHVIVSFAACFQRGSSPHTRGALRSG